VGQRHRGHGPKSRSCYRTGLDREKESGHQGGRPGGLDSCRPDPDSWTEEDRGVPTAAARKAVQINPNAETETKPNPKAESSTSTSTETDTNTHAKSRINAKSRDDIISDNDQTMGDGPTTKPTEASQPSTSPNNSLEHGRQMPNRNERRECATPQ